MESSQEQPNPKLQCKNGESSDVPKKPLKIDDLVDFCLLNILERLDAISLSNVADTNKRLRWLAIDVYERKFGAKKIIIDTNAARNTYYRAGKMTVDTRSIQVCGLQTCLQYLRNFGPYIHDLWISYYDPNDEHYEYMHEYVNDFCAENLVRIKFEGLVSCSIEKFQKVFVNIRDVVFVDCYLGENWSSLARWSPNLRSLNFGGVRMVYRSIKKPFPNLEHLCIKELAADEFTSIKIASDLLDGINQLKSLEIYVKTVSITELLDLVKDNPSISKLSAFEVNGLATSKETQRLISEHPALVELKLDCCTFTTNDVIAMIRQLSSLKRFKFQLQINCLSNELSDFELQLNDCGWDLLSVCSTGGFSRIWIFEISVEIVVRSKTD